MLDSHQRGWVGVVPPFKMAPADTEQFPDDPIARHAVAALEASGFKVRGATARETIENIRQVLAENPDLDLSERQR